MSWTAELHEGPLHGERIVVAHAYLLLAVPIPRERGWPCEFALYRLARKETKDFTHRYAFQALRRATYAEKLLFDGGRHAWEAPPTPNGRLPQKKDQPRELGSSGAVVSSNRANGSSTIAA